MQKLRKRFILFGFGVVLLLVGITGVVSYASLTRLLEAQDLQESSLQIRLALLRLLSMLADAETAQRGYIITGDATFLEPYTSAASGISASFEALTLLTVQDSKAGERLGRLKGLVHQKLAIVADNIATRRLHGAELAERRVTEGSGKAIMDAIRRQVGRMDADETVRLHLRSRQLEAAGERSQLIVTTASLLAVFTAGFALDQVRRGFRDTALAQAELEHSHALLEERVGERTALLRDALARLEDENNERKQLEEEVLQISEREQRRIAQDLHDGLGQLLAGAFHLMTALQHSLSSKALPEEAEADNLKLLIKEALDQTRSISRGLYPVTEASGALMIALKELASRTSELFDTNCQFICAARVYIDDNIAATHLYRIAQEAITNAVKHGNASAIQISLTRSDERVILQVRDNGSGLRSVTEKQPGLGTRIMLHRAALLKGTLVLESPAEGGTIVWCVLSSKPQTASLNT